MSSFWGSTSDCSNGVMKEMVSSKASVISLCLQFCVANDGSLEIILPAYATWRLYQFLRSALKCTGIINTIRCPLPRFHCLSPAVLCDSS